MSKNLESILEILNAVPDINRGGCGISALTIYRWCKKNGVSVSDHPFVVLCEDEWEVSHNNAACENGKVNEITIPHVVIEIGGELHDSEGIDGGLILSNPYRQDYQLNEAELLSIINMDAWNSMFNRERWKDYIAEELDIDLSDIELFN
jgi:hypothetical protein